MIDFIVISLCIVIIFIFLIRFISKRMTIQYKIFEKNSKFIVTKRFLILFWIRYGKFRSAQEAYFHTYDNGIANISRVEYIYEKWWMRIHK